jgi:PAS domain S-box-containing protein
MSVEQPHPPDRQEDRVLDTRPQTTRAAARAVVPTGEARTFSADELIVSKTDPRGVITYANDVFLRVSGYAHHQVVGQPHNLIRHPDMPQAVFALLWDTLAAGRELFAYINNLAADGAHYWVLAHVTPSYDARGSVAGYHSSRRRPSAGAVAEVVPIYEQLLAEERRHPTGKAAVAASSRLLVELLEQRGESYEEFIWSIIGREEK